MQFLDLKSQEEVQTISTDLVRALVGRVAVMKVSEHHGIR